VLYVETQEHPTLSIHCFAKLIPVGVLTGNLPIKSHKTLHGLGQVNHVNAGVYLNPATEESIR
jgi:hypothetical protein